MYDHYTNGYVRMDPEDENYPRYRYNSANGFVAMDPEEAEDNYSNNSSNYYYIDLDKVVNQMKRYSCTCLSGQGGCKTHDANEQSKPTQKLMVPLHRTNGRTSVDAANAQGVVARAKKGQKVSDSSETDKQKKMEMERENFRRWLIDKAKQKEDKIKMEKQQQLRKQREIEEKKKMRKAEGELRYKLWLKEKERENLENKIREQLEILTTAEEKQRRLQKSEEAYKQWLHKSAYKSKPVPHSKGLESLKSSACCVFRNPEPWMKDEKNDTKNLRA